MTINGGCAGKKTPKIAPTGVRVAERRTIGRSWRRDREKSARAARCFSSSSLQLSGRFDPIISSSRLPHLHQPYCRSPSSPHAWSSLFIYSTQAPPVVSPPCPATPRGPSHYRAVGRPEPRRILRHQHLLPSPPSTNRRPIPHDQCRLSASKMGRRKIEIKAIKDDRNRSV